MNEIRLTIDGEAFPFSACWVHLQQIADQRSAPFTAYLANDKLNAVFDPYDTRDPAESWPEFVSRQIEELGTFILEGYWKSIANHLGETQSPYSWVIARVDDVAEAPAGLEIRGRVVRFLPR